jgi:16S rRNA (adenine1518-N6/adenine1519-N6)-dimethyltransferase
VPRRNQPAPRSSRHGSSRQGKAPSSQRARIGQHFLVDPLVAHDIVAAAQLSSTDDVLEVGPGKGALTEQLLEQAAHVTAVELDEYLADLLRRRFAGNQQLTVVASSILEHPPDIFLGEGGRSAPYLVVANLPYYITAPVMRHFLERGQRPTRMIVMVQKEVAESMARTGHGLSLLGVSVQVFGAVREILRVRPNSFDPPPKVESAVVRVDIYPQPRVPEEELEGFFSVVRSGFHAPRKQLHNSLGGGLWLPPGEAPGLLEEAGIDPMRRPATLTVEEWYALYRAYESARPGFAERIPGVTAASAAEYALAPDESDLA